MAIWLYLDTNVLCRPFDDQTIARIRRETEAFELILDKITNDEAALVTSEILVFEIQRILSPPKKSKASGYLQLSKSYHGLSQETFRLAEEIMAKFKLEPRDALHVASAILERSQYFLSCDDGITRRFKKKLLSVTIKNEEQMLNIMNPLDFTRQIGW